MKNLIAVFSAVLMLSVICPAQPQINGFTVLGDFNDHAYYVSNSSMHWTEARDACVAAGGHLATIGSAEENAFIWNQAVILRGPSGGAPWIGFTDSSVEGQWLWETGEPVTYTNWAPGQPDNSNGDQDYAHMWAAFGGGTWDDVGNDDLDYAILEIDGICPPTSLPFADNFDSPTLDSCWYWIREDTSHWSLTERPGWMRIWTEHDSNFDGQGNGRNVLLRSLPATSFRAETKLYFSPIEEQQYAGMVCYVPGHLPLRVWRVKQDGVNCVTFQADEGAPVNWNVPCPQDLVWFRLDVVDHLTFAWYSIDSTSWLSMGSCITNWVPSDNMSVGVTTTEWYYANTSADFDYFRVDPLPGTNVCGNVSGVWDSTGSPYFVTCDVTVPAGQTLEIRPGVQVLFTGHYKFNVYGNLQAIGTEQDSIVFTRAFPTEESKWWGIRFSFASDSSRLVYCKIQNGLATGSWYDNAGGGVCCYHTSPSIANCTISANAADHGGGVYCQTAAPRLTNCVISGNHANGLGGGLLCLQYSEPTLVNCVLSGNVSSDGGGVYSVQQSQPLFLNCSIVANHATGSGGGLFFGFDGVVPECCRNCILWGNSAQTSSSVEGNPDVSYSDIQGGYPGIGNIDADPMFADTANGDFHLQAGSLCIDSGDPSSPLDSDSTRADMGAFPYIHTTLIVCPSALDFGLIDLGTDSVRHVSLRNPSTPLIPVVSIGHAEIAFSVDTTGLGGHIPPHASYQLAVTFNPVLAGVYVDTLVIVVTQQGDSVIRVPLRGEAEIILPPVDSLVAQKGPLNGIRLDWSAVTHSISGQPVQNVVYSIYGSTSTEGPFVPFGYSTTNSFVHPYILNGQAKYFYQVTADVESGRGLTRQIGKRTQTPVRVQ